MRMITIYTLSAVLILLQAPELRAQDVYVYPTKNQTDEQMGRDKEECHDWAVKQTGVDPVTMAAEPPAASKSAGEERSAARPWAPRAGRCRARPEPERCMASASDGWCMRSARDRQMEEQQDAQAKEQQQRQAQLQKYDRAYGACLTGRGYTVQ